MRSVLVKAVGLSSLALMLLVMASAKTLFVGNLEFTDAETEVSFWGRGSYQPDQRTIARTSRSIERLIEGSKLNPSYLHLSANALAWLAYWESDKGPQEQFVQQSIAAQTAAIESRPAHRQSWIKLIEYLSNTNNSGETEVWAKGQLARLQINTKNDLKK